MMDSISIYHFVKAGKKMANVAISPTRPSHVVSLDNAKLNKE